MRIASLGERGLWRGAILALAALGLSACVGAAPRQAGTGPASLPGRAAPRVSASGPVETALLLPVSRADAAAEVRDLEAAARMAEAESRGAVRLTVYDTGGSAAGAAAAAGRAAAEGAVAMVGPLYMGSAQAVKPALRASGLSALAMTPAAFAAGSGVHVMGFTPEDEVDAIIGYAASQGRTAIALIRPANDQYGDVVERAARAAAARHGAQIVSSTSYVRSSDAIATGMRDAAAQLKAAGANAALLVDRGQGLVAVAAFLNYYDVSPQQVKYLGLSGWDTRSTLREPSLQGGWFAAPDPSLRAAFDSRFTAANGRKPARSAPIAYDAVRAVAELAPQARGGAVTSALIGSRSYSGALGAFRFGPDQVVRRSMAVLEVGPGGFSTLRAASTNPAAGS